MKKLTTLLASILLGGVIYATPMRIIFSMMSDTINAPTTYTGNQTLSCRIGIVNEGVLTITGTTTMSGNAKIRVCEGGTLIVDGGIIQNADFVLVPGSSVIIRNGGVINMAVGKSFEAPVGAVVNIESGEIN